MLDLKYVDNVFTIKVARAKIGIGSTNEVTCELRRRSSKKVLIVCGENLYKRTGVVSNVVKLLKSEGVDAYVWSGVIPEPTLDSIFEGVKYAMDIMPDTIIGIGGGSAIDSAKLINLYLTYPASDPLEYIPHPVGRGKPIPGPLKPLIAIPTTAGSGSETTPTAVISVKEYEVKFGITNEYLMPSLAIVDPLNTLSMPQHVTASTGLDALMHAIEAYTARTYSTRQRPDDVCLRPAYVGSNPFTDALAEKSIELISKYLRRAYNNGLDLEARYWMSLASYLAGIALGNAGTHISHAISLVLGGITNAPHGVCAALTAPALLDVLANVIPERVARIYELLGGNEGGSVKEKALRASNMVKELMSELEVPNGLLELGIKEEQIPLIAERTLMMRRLLAQSPIEVSKGVIEKILRKSLSLW